jgi:subtilisin family serine protease
MTPDLTEVIVRHGDTEAVAAMDALKARGFQAKLPPRAGSDYQVFAAPETEAVPLSLVELRQKVKGSRVIPSFKDAGGARRFFDPEYCVVQFTDGVPQAEQDTVIRNAGLAIYTRHRTDGLYTLHLAGANLVPGMMFDAIARLAANPSVKLAEPAYLGFDDHLEWPAMVAAVADYAAPLSWNLEMIRAADAWSHVTGSPDVIVAIVDSGVDVTHPALAGGILTQGPNENWNFESESDPFPTDDEGHGTFIAGLLIGNGAMGVQGICPKCRVLPLKIPTGSGVDSYARRRDAILYALRYVPEGKRCIINLSWKVTGDVALIRDAIASAETQNALVTASAGNSPTRPNEPHYPSDYPTVLSVASVTPDRKRSEFSYYGDQVDISAPGGVDASESPDNIRSTAPGDDIVMGAGTSFAAPQVAGVAALVLSQQPRLKAIEVRHVIMATAEPIDERGMGRGVVDAAAAVSSLLVTQPPGPSAHSPPVDSGSVLATINSARAETLVSQFDLLTFTARLIEARRPFNSLDEIRGFGGLSDEQFARLSKQTDSVLAAINSANFQMLVSRFGLLTYTARLIEARRPFNSVGEIRGFGGLSDEQFARITKQTASP